MAAITVFRGDSYPLIFTLKNKVTGAPIPITGYVFTLTVSSAKDPVDESTKLFSVDSTIVDGPNGKFSFLPTSEQNGVVGKYFFDIQMITPELHCRTIEKDKYTINQDIGKVAINQAE